MRTQLCRTALTLLGLGLSSCAQSAIRDDVASDASLSGDAGEDGLDEDAGGAGDMAKLPMRDGGLDASLPTRRDGSVAATGDGGDGGHAVDGGASGADAGTLAPSDAGSDATTAAPAPAATMPSGCSARTIDGKGYLVCTEARGWSGARQVCQQARMDLVVVDGVPENDLVRTMPDAWIGISDQDAEGTWLTLVPGDAQRSDGRPVGYTNWGPGEPNNTQQRCSNGEGLPGCPAAMIVDEDCASMRIDGFWNDSECAASKPFVCEALSP